MVELTEMTKEKVKGLQSNPKKGEEESGAKEEAEDEMEWC